MSLAEKVGGEREGQRVPVGKIAAAGSFIAVPFFGALSDRIGRRPVYLWAFVLTFNTAHDAQYGTQAAYFSELFSTHVRYSGISISAQLGGVLAGAFAAEARPAVRTGRFVRRDREPVGVERS